MADVELDVTFETLNNQVSANFGTVYVIDNGVAVKIIADKYSNTNTYEVGNYVIDNDLLYKCITAVEEPEEFDPEKWLPIKLANDVNGKADTTYVDTELAKKADKSNTYTKTQIDDKLSEKANADDVYQKTETYSKTETDNLVSPKADKSYVDTQLQAKANASDVYGKAYIDTALSGKANVGASYTKSEEDALLANKADKSDTYTKNEVDDIVYNILPDDTASGSVANFETDLALPIKSLEVDVNAIQAAGTPTPATPLPISGWSEISLVNCGANLCNQADIVGAYPAKYTVDTDGSIKTVGNLGLADVLWTNKSKVSGVLNVVFVPKYQNTGSVGIRPKIVYTDGTTSIIYTTNTQDYSVKTLLTNSSKTVEKIVVDYGTNNPTNFFLEVTLNTSASTYEPYNGTTEVINLGDTYYGGHFTQDKAGHRQFEVTHGIKLFGDISFSRSNNGGAWQSYLFYAQITDKTNGGVLKCSNYEYVIQATSTMQNEKIISAGSSKYVYVRDDAYTTVADFKTANANTQLVYPLATPIIIDLPDGEPIITLNGTNNIYADTGDCAVEYKCSVAEYVANHSGGGGAKSLGGVFLGGSNSGSEEESTEESEEPKEVKEIPSDEPISEK